MGNLAEKMSFNEKDEALKYFQEYVLSTMQCSLSPLSPPPPPPPPPPPLYMFACARRYEIKDLDEIFQILSEKSAAVRHSSGAWHARRAHEAQHTCAHGVQSAHGTAPRRTTGQSSRKCRPLPQSLAVACLRRTRI